MPLFLQPAKTGGNYVEGYQRCALSRCSYLHRVEVHVKLGTQAEFAVSLCDEVELLTSDGFPPRGLVGVTVSLQVG